MHFTRDSFLLWGGLLGALIAYLLSVGDPPNQWSYQQWLQFGTAMLAVAIAKLQNSPLPSTAEKKADDFDKGKLLLPFVLLASLGLSACAANAPPDLTPAATAAFRNTQVIKGLDILRDTAVAAHAAALLSTDTTRTIVRFHESALKTIDATTTGWAPTVTQALEEVSGHLPPKERELLTPYVNLVKILLQEIQS